MNYKLLVVALIISAVSCKNNEHSETDTSNSSNTIAAPQMIMHTLVGMHPHDTSSFTEGLQLYDNALFESTGMYGSSKLIKSDLSTGDVIKEIALAGNYFGEGISILRDTIYMMTYQEKTGFKYDAKTLKQVGTFSYDNEGWGMTNDGTSLIQSDGSSNLYYREPSTFRTQKIVSVTDNNGPVAMINELEYVDGFIYANVWHTNYIIKIDPSNGHVVAKTDLSDITNQVARENPAIDQESVLNGIAYHPVKKTFYVTGKRWPAIYEIKLQ